MAAAVHFSLTGVFERIGSDARRTIAPGDTWCGAGNGASRSRLRTALSVSTNLGEVTCWNCRYVQKLWKAVPGVVDGKPINALAPRADLRSRYFLFGRGFRDGAAGVDVRHPGYADYERGHEEGVLARGRAQEAFAKEIDYEPSPLRLQSSDDGEAEDGR